MSKQFKFVGKKELNEKGESIVSGMNFGRFGRLEIGQVIEATDAEAVNIDTHDLFEEIVAKPAGKAKE